MSRIFGVWSLRSKRQPGAPAPQPQLPASCGREGAGVPLEASSATCWLRDLGQGAKLPEPLPHRPRGAAAPSRWAPSPRRHGGRAAGRSRLRAAASRGAPLLWETFPPQRPSRQATGMARGPSAQWVPPPLPQVLAAHLGLRPQPPPRGALEESPAGTGDAGPGSPGARRPAQAALSSPGEVGTDSGLPRRLALLHAPQPAAPLGPYLKPWERCCPGREDLGARDGAVGFRPRQRSPGCQQLGSAVHARPVLAAPVGSDGRGGGRCGGPGGRRGTSVCPAGAPCQLWLRPRLRTPGQAPCEQRAAPAQSPARGARAGGEARGRAGRGARAAAPRAPPSSGLPVRPGSCPWC